MDVIIDYLHHDIQESFSYLSKEDSEQREKAFTALNSLLRKSLMEIVKHKSNQKMVELNEMDNFDQEKAVKILNFLGVEFKSLASVLHSEELVTNLVHEAMGQLQNWGKNCHKNELMERNQILYQQTSAIQQHKQIKKGKNQVKMRKSTNSVATKTKSSEATGIENLTSIKISDLELFKVHTGKFVKGQLIGQPCVTTGVTHLLEDSDGTVTILGVYNLTEVEKNEDFERLFPRESWITIKEPFFKIFDSGEKGIRVDDPKDINIFTEVAEEDKLTTTTTTKLDDQSSGQSSDEEIIARLSTKLAHYRTKGNKLFIEKKFDHALSAYLEGVNYVRTQLQPLLSSKDNDKPSERKQNSKAVDSREISQFLSVFGLADVNENSTTLQNLREIIPKLSEVGLICSNIAICYKELKFYRKSIAYSKLVPIFNVSANIKQQNEFRNLQCQFISGRISSLNVGAWNEMEKRLTKSEMASLKILESQSLKGGYDWDKIVKKYLDPQESKKQLFEVADFCGKVKFQEISGKGLGVVASKNISKGELVMVSKALWQSERNMNETFSDTISVELILSGPQSKLVREVKLRSKDDPILKAKVKALFAGSKFNRIPYKDVVKLSQSEDMNEDDLGELSAEQIGYAVRFNTFGSNSGGVFHSKDDLANSTFAGLWLEPSFFNHDDNPNVCWVVMGNLMVMRAATDIRAGNELTITYSCELRINERRKTLKDYAFNYDLSHSDKTLLESISNKSDLISNLKIQSQKLKNDKQKMEILNRAIKINNSIIKEHYPLIADNQPIVMGVLYDKMDLYLGVGNRKKAKEAAIQILDSFPCYVNEDFLHTIMESFPGKADVDLYEALQKCVELIYGTKNLEMFF